MSMRTACAQAETLAGAIALGEVDEIERSAYRAHLSECADCCNALGGEREIERVVCAVRNARDGETWTPTVRPIAARNGIRGDLFAWSALAVALLFAVAISQLTPRYRSVVVPSANAPSISQEDARAIAVLDTQVPPRREHHAESLAVGPALTVRRVTLQLGLDGRGAPKQCIVARSSGDRTLDAALCRAAMRHVK